MFYRRTQTLRMYCLILAIPLIGLAAPAPVESITTSPATSPSTLVEDGDGVIDLTDITVGGTTYSSLEGSSVLGGNVLSVGLYIWTDTNPGGTPAATEGLRMNASGAGGGSNDGDYVFANASETDTFFLFELEGNDGFTLNPIDGSGNAIGTLSLTLSSSDFGGAVVGMQTPNKSTGGTGSNVTVHGTSFTLSDFSGSGDTSNFAGFNIATSGGDLTVLARASSGGGAPSGNVDGVDNVYNNWHAWGYDWGSGDPYITSISNTYTTTEFGGTATTFTIDSPLEGVDVSDPDNPVHGSGTASYLGAEVDADRLGVGHATTGRFSRGDSFTLTASRTFKLKKIAWRQVGGVAAQIHIAWTRDGNPEEARVAVPTTSSEPIMDLTSYNIVQDAGTGIVFTNVSDSSEPYNGRVGFKFFIGCLQFAEEPWYDMTVNGGIPQMIGVNIAGADFTPLAFYEADRAPEQWEYYEEKGMELIRFPLRWHRLQPTPGGALDQDELDHLLLAADLCEQHNMKMIIDIHDYFSWGYQDQDPGKPYPAVPIGESYNGISVSEADFRDLWRRLALEFKNHPAIYGYGLMNEPKDAGDADWASAAQQAIYGIRNDAGDSDTWIILSGHGWGKANGWPQERAQTIAVNDPQDKIMYEAHIYFDDNSSGDYNEDYDGEVVFPELFMAKPAQFISWLQATGNRGFIGEFNVPDDGDPRWLEGLEEFMDTVLANGLSATYWAGGSAWGSGDLYLHPEDNYQTDKPQMDVMELYGVNGDLPSEIIVDNADASGVTKTGTWTTTSGVSGYHGDNYFYTNTVGEGKSVEFTPNLETAGVYTVYMNWPSASSRSTAVPVDITHAGGTDPISVNQRENGGTWVELGTYSFNSGTGGRVTVLDDASSGSLVADAVRFVWQSGGSGTGTVIPTDNDTYINRQFSGDDYVAGSDEVLAVQDTAATSSKSKDYNAVVSFDLSAFSGDPVSGAQLELETVNFNGWTYEVYAIPDGGGDESFSEGTLNYQNFDHAYSGSLHSGNSSNGGDGSLVTDNLVLLGQFTAVDGVNSFSSTALTNFLNADTNNRATFVIHALTESSAGNPSSFAAKENTGGYLVPQLTLD